jgi:hypothetical protein
MSTPPKRYWDLIDLQLLQALAGENLATQAEHSYLLAFMSPPCHLSGQAVASDQVRSAHPAVQRR